MQTRQEDARLPLEVMYSINLMLELADLVQLAKTCRTANQFVNDQLHLSTPNIRAFWARSLIKIGLTPSLATDFTNSDAVKDYGRLYQIVRITPEVPRKAFVLWELACLSGSAEAVQHAIQHWGLTADNTGYYGNALLNTAFSGSVDAMRVAYAIDPVRLSEGVIPDRGTATNLAAESGSIPALRLAFEEYKIPTAEAFFGDRVPMHSAAKSGSLLMMHYVAKNWPGSRVDGLRTYDQSHETILSYAIATKSLDAIDYAIHLACYPTQDAGIKDFYLNAWRKAFEGDSPDVMRRLFEERPRHINGLYALYLAIYYGSPTGLMFAISQLNADIIRYDIIQIIGLALARPTCTRAYNNLRLICGLKELDPSLRPMAVSPDVRPEIYNIFNESTAREIRESEEYKEWTAPFQFKEHKAHPVIELDKPLLNRQIKGSLGIGIFFAVVGALMFFTAAPFLIPMIMYGIASVLLGYSAYLDNKKSSLDRQISEVLTPSPRPKVSTPAANVELSYARIAPFIAINRKIAEVSDVLPPQADSKREAHSSTVGMTVISPSAAPLSTVYRR